MQEVEPGHLRLSPLSRRQDDDVAIREIVDLAHADGRLGGHAQSMADVLGLSPREVGYRIDEDQFVPRAFSNSERINPPASSRVSSPARKRRAIGPRSGFFVAIGGIRLTNRA